MKQDEKELLLKDLCARLPYNVYVDRIGIAHKLIGVNSADKTVTINNEDYMPTTFFINASEIPVKPYLRPMSSMTKEERKEYELLANRCITNSVGFVHFDAQELMNWLLKNNFDYCGLIGKSLAIEVTEENNPYKN